MKKLTIDSSVIIAPLLENEPRHERFVDLGAHNSGQGRCHYALLCKAERSMTMPLCV